MIYVKTCLYTSFNLEGTRLCSGSDPGLGAFASVDCRRGTMLPRVNFSPLDPLGEWGLSTL